MRCGAVIDVGSGSVGIAIVVSDAQSGTLEIVWSHREYMLIKDVRDDHGLLKDINTTLVNTLLELGSNGLKSLHAFDQSLSIETLEVALSAPWSYTVTKKIQYENEEEFEVTKTLLEDLIESARKQTVESSVDGKSMEDLGLSIIAKHMLSIELNGYYVQDPYDKKVTALSIYELHALAEVKILATLKEMQEKLLPKAQMHVHSFMTIFYQVMRSLYPNTSESCLIDITNEATEIGIVRDDILRHTAHAQVGLYNLAREIAVACNIPKEEAYNLLKDGAVLVSSYSKEQQHAMNTVFEAYESAIATLLKDTGDALSIPRTIFLHTSQNTESFFKDRLKAAAQKAITEVPSIHMFTSELLGKKTMTDTALALSAHYFHTKGLYKDTLLS